MRRDATALDEAHTSALFNFSLEKDLFVLLDFIPQGQNIHPRKFPDQRHRVNSHRSQPSAQQLNPAQAAAAPGLHDSSTLPWIMAG